MDKKLFFILFFPPLIIIIGFFSYQFIEVKTYKSKIDIQLHDRLLVMEENQEKYQKNISTSNSSTYNHSIPNQPLSWGSKIVRIINDITTTQDESGIRDGHTFNNIEIKEKVSDTDWKTLVRQETPFCDYGIVNSNNILLCMTSDGSGTFLNMISQDGRVTKKYITSSPDASAGTVLLDNQTLYFIFTDDRFVWSLPILGDAPHEIGTQFLMAGELNLDTLAFKEHVIGYANVKFFKGGYSMTTLLPQVKQPESQVVK